MIKNVFKYINNNNYEINISDGKLYVMNYIKIIDLNDKLILVSLNNRLLTIKGDNLSINKLNENELYIIGNIKGIDINDE